MENEEKQDSVTLGSAVKGGAVKVYMDLNKLTDDEAKALTKRAVGLHKFLMGINQ